MQLPTPTTRPKGLEIIELSNVRGDLLEVLTLGAIIKSWNISSRRHGAINIVLGYPHWQSYLSDGAYHGAMVGRYCNRIANSRFAIGGEEYRLPSNEGPHHLHGGPEGFNRRIWNVRERNEQRVVLDLHSPDGDQGYPGNLDISLCYLLDDEGALEITWEATSDKDTVVSLTNHAYFNLAGAGDIRDHHLRIPASRFTPTGPGLIPTGEIRPVQDTPLDFRDFVRLGEVLDSDNPEIDSCGGLDHNWVTGCDGVMEVAAELVCWETNLLLQASSTLPGLQCYTGNHLAARGIHGAHEGICLEAQYFPNSPNEPSFPSPFLRAGDSRTHRIRYQACEVESWDMLARTPVNL